jgi:hypothetical protein
LYGNSCFPASTIEPCHGKEQIGISSQTIARLIEVLLNNLSSLKKRILFRTVTNDVNTRSEWNHLNLKIVNATY